jgi:2-oxoglutarate ferredoxin oxidoreductase subunit alpha
LDVLPAHRWHERFLKAKSAKEPETMRANLMAFHAGWTFGETT